MSEAYYPIPEIVGFIRKADRGGVCFGGWTDDFLEPYLHWHYKSGSMVIKLQEGNLVAVAIISTIFEDVIDQHHQVKEREGKSLAVQDSMEKEGRGVEENVSELSRRCHRDVMFFSVESVLDKIIEGLK